MRSAKIFVNNQFAGYFIEKSDHKDYEIRYRDNYVGQPISLTLPIENKNYFFDQFPSFFEGLLPEGAQLEALLRKAKLDKNDYFGQIVHVGHDLVGAVTLEAENKSND